MQSLTSTVTDSSAVTSAAKESPANKRRRRRNRNRNRNRQDGPPWWLLSAFLGVAALVVVLYGWSVSSAPLILIELLIGSCAAAVGSLFGFVFGMPRASVAPAMREEGDEKDSRVGYQPSTNLEQVSDWLTKILIGVGLVELRQIGDALAAMGRVVAGSLNVAPAGTVVVTQAVIAGFSVLGFLASFLWTRIYYGPLQAIADDEVIKGLKNKLQQSVKQLQKSEQRLNEERSSRQDFVEQVKNQDIVLRPPKTEAKKLAAAEDDWKNWDTDVVDKIEKLRKAEPRWEDDTVADIFKDAKQEDRGRRLEAELQREVEDALSIQLRVRGVGDRPLTGTVVFLLHPTFPNPVIAKRAANNKAEITIYSEGWSTVAAVMDGGKTVLSYNLKELPGVPDWFKEA